MARHDELPGIHFWPITGIHLRMLDAIASAFAVMRAETSIADLLPASFDIVFLNDTDLRDVALATRQVAEELVADMVAANAGSASTRTESQALDALMLLLAGERVRMSRARRDAAIDDAAPMFREIGLERHDIECHIQLGPDDGDELVSTPIPRPTAYISLLQPLLARAELFVLGDEFSAAERDASAWYFDRWNANADADAPMDREAAEFASSWREAEWTLITRDTILDEETVMVALMNSPDFADVPPRQQQLARALQRSVVDAFEITAIDGSVMTARSCRDGTVYRIYEHNPEATPIIGMVVLGRLIPFEDDLWLRSPGAVMMLPADPSDISAIGEGLAEVTQRVPTPIAVEALISDVIYGANVPVDLKPASSAKNARLLFDEMVAALVELDLVVRLPAADAPPELAPLASSPDREVVRFAVDDVMGEWLSALAAQAADADRRETRQAAKKKQRKGKKAKRRR